MLTRNNFYTSSLLVVCATILTVFQTFQSCTITSHSYKVKNNSGNIFFNRPDTMNSFKNSILNRPISLDNILKSNFRDSTSKFHAYLINTSDNSSIEAYSKNIGSDSISLFINRIDRNKNVLDTIVINLAAKDLGAHQLILKNISDFDIVFNRDSFSNKQRQIFSIRKFNAFALNNYEFQVLTGEMNNQQDNYEFIILNDPETLKILMPAICILSFCKSWETKCQQMAIDKAAKTKTRCKYRVRYKNFDWLLFEKDVYCEITCPSK